MRREIKDAETARKLARTIEALQRGEPLARAAAYGGLERRTVLRVLEALGRWAANFAEAAGGAVEASPAGDVAAGGSGAGGGSVAKSAAPGKSGARAASSGRRKARGEWRVARLTAYADGGSRGNPGQAACAVILFDEKDEELLRRSRRLGVTTNNVAEYEAVLLALEFAEALGARDLEIRLDSELVVRQLKGEYKVKHPTLKPLHARALQQMTAFNQVIVSHVRRKENKPADDLVNDELDGKADGTSVPLDRREI